MTISSKKVTLIVILLICQIIQSCGGFTAADLTDSFTSESDDNPSATTSCVAQDGDCFQSNIQAVDEDGANISFIAISQDLPNADTATGSAPSITSVTLANGASEMSLSSPTSVTQMWITFLDPLGSRPAFCMQACPKGVQCSTSGYKCTRSNHDGLISGTYKTWLGYKAEPAGAAGTTDEYVLSIIPISTPDGSDPIGIFEDTIKNGGTVSTIGTDQLSVGEPYELDQTLTKQEDSSSDENTDGGGTGEEESSCTSSTQCMGSCFTTRSCVDGLSCSCSGSASSGVCYNVSCNTAGGSCGDGVNACCVGYSCTNGACVSASSASCF